MHQFFPRQLIGEASTHHEARWGRGKGLRVASTLWLPHFRQRRRLTNAAIGVLGVIAKRKRLTGQYPDVAATKAPYCDS
jgi:hypothetical protein